MILYTAPMRILGAALLCISLAACSSLDGQLEGGIQVERNSTSLQDFSAPSSAVLQQARTLSLDPKAYQAPIVEIDAELISAAGPQTSASMGTGVAEVVSQSPDGEVQREIIARVEVEDPAVNKPWPIEGLVGQINGRPLFADKFLEPIAARIVTKAASPDRVEARRELIELVRFAFKDYVDSELVIAEAEAGLSTEQQQGLFAWLASMQEAEVAERGGSLIEAETSLMNERGMSIDEFLQERRDITLAQQLLRKRIEPRAIVSWRDIEREYRRHEAEINPPPSILIGRIRLDTTTNAAKVAQVKQLIAEGKTLPEIADVLGIANRGAWNEFKLPPEGIRGLPLADAVRDRLMDLPTGKPSAPLELPDSITWVSVLGITETQVKSVFDPDVQLRLREELRGQRSMIERDRWLRSLRTRWVSDNIAEMEARLVQIALARYWQ